MLAKGKKLKRAPFVLRVNWEEFINNEVLEAQMILRDDIGEEEEGCSVGNLQHMSKLLEIMMKAEKNPESFMLEKDSEHWKITLQERTGSFKGK